MKRKAYVMVLWALGNVVVVVFAAVAATTAVRNYKQKEKKPHPCSCPNAHGIIWLKAAVAATTTATRLIRRRRKRREKNRQTDRETEATAEQTVNQLNDAF